MGQPGGFPNTYLQRCETIAASLPAMEKMVRRDASALMKVITGEGVDGGNCSPVSQRPSRSNYSVCALQQVRLVFIHVPLSMFGYLWDRTAREIRKHAFGRKYLNCWSNTSRRFHIFESGPIRFWNCRPHRKPSDCDRIIYERIAILNKSLRRAISTEDDSFLYEHFIASTDRLREEIATANLILDRMLVRPRGD
jgi:hypothetical protein